MFERSFFSKKNLSEAAYILSIKIYRDRSKCLISFFMSTYLDKILKEFKMDQSNKEIFPVLLWYLPAILIAKHTSGLVHSIAYMIEPMAEA